MTQHESGGEVYSDGEMNNAHGSTGGAWPTCAGQEMIFMDTFVKGHLGSGRMQGNIGKGGKGEMASLVVETNRIHSVFSYLL